METPSLLLFSSQAQKPFFLFLFLFHVQMFKNCPVETYQVFNFKEGSENLPTSLYFPTPTLKEVFYSDCDSEVQTFPTLLITQFQICCFFSVSIPKILVTIMLYLSQAKPAPEQTCKFHRLKFQYRTRL